MKVADMHCDTILAILRGKEQGKEISLRKNNLLKLPTPFGVLNLEKTIL